MNQTKEFFVKNGTDSPVQKNIQRGIQMVEEWMELLYIPCPYLLSNGNLSIDYLHLTESIKDNTLNELAKICKSIRAEALLITTAESLQDFKDLNDFWETLQQSFEIMTK
jgi:hypothetical protein